MKIKLIIVALVALMLTGCGFFENNSETIVFYGKTDWVMDNEFITAPDGYFINFYELKKIDEHTLQLVLTLTDNKGYGEM
jgi:hypothetical protein